jgi:multiple sugar transport system permease protein
LLLELALGLALALALDRAFRGRGAVRAAVLLPWALPTVVAALLFRFLFEGHAAWFADPLAAWVPIVLADVWKTTPFVALLLLAGLQGIDPGVYEAARVDGANAWQLFTRITLPLLRPTLVVAALLRALDAFRVFDLIYVLTAGGPGTATESLALYTYSALLTSLRFGYAAALSVLIFAGAFLLAFVFVRVLGADLAQGKTAS